MAGPFPCPNPPSPCETSPNPATGFSSETADSTTFIGLAWNGKAPPLNKPFNLVPCEAIADSQVSQVDADRLAQNAAVACAGTCTQPFGNTPQTASGRCSDGSAYFLTIAAGQYLAENQLLADRLAFTAATRALIGHSLCLGSLVPSTACINEFYFAIISLASTDALAGVELTQGELPTGLTMQVQSDRVVIQGTPVAFGISLITLTATNTAGVITSKNYSITVAGITTDSSLPEAIGGTPYFQPLTASNPNSLPTSWSIIAGSLPAGLSLDASSGIISGNISQSGLFSFTVQVSFGATQCQKDFTLNAQMINWNAIVWSAPLLEPGAAPVGVVSGVFSGNSFSVYTQWNGGPNAAYVEGYGTLNYTGPSVNCQVRVVTTNTLIDNTCGFQIRQDGNLKVDASSVNIGAVGTYVLNFTIDATLGSLIEIIGRGSNFHFPLRIFCGAFNSGPVNGIAAYGATIVNL